MIELYTNFMTCVIKIWDGSPATERIDSSVETIEVEVSTQASDQMDMEDTNIV